MNGMTGYSFKEFYHDDIYISTEIKTVNSRYLDINVYVPYYLNSIEINIRELLKKKFSRGKIDASVSLRQTDAAYNVEIDLKLAKQYADNLNKLIKQFNLKDDLRLFHLTKYDDVIHVKKKRDYSEHWDLISKSFMENIKEILLMRKKEGEGIKKDLFSIISKISKDVDFISKEIPKMEKEIYNNIKNKVSDLVGNNVDELKLLNETAFLVSRSCVNEEVQRLKSHISQFLVIAQEKNDVGKRLDFVCQELHREINTTGSKVTLVKLTGNVIAVKNNIEKMREQIRNIE